MVIGLGAGFLTAAIRPIADAEVLPYGLPLHGVLGGVLGVGVGAFYDVTLYSVLLVAIFHASFDASISQLSRDVVAASTRRDSSSSALSSCWRPPS